jgi:regulator of sigma E protease
MLGIVKILLGLLGLSLVVVVHEAGHFILARLSGIHVEAFSIGWGKVLWARKWGDTEYRISLFPLGGYCKMQGEQAMIQAWESKARSIDTEEGDMYAAAWWQRILVSLAGPYTNLICAGLIFFMIALIGYKVHYYPSRIVMASAYTERTDYPADEAGLKTGDLITAVDGVEIERFDQLQEAIVIHPREVISLTVNRSGRSIEITAVPEMNRDSGAGYLGIYPWIAPVVRAADDQAAGDSGLHKGDLILSANGDSIEHGLDLSRAVSGLAEGERLSLTVERNGEIVELEGFQPGTAGNIRFEYLTKRTVSGRPVRALREGWRETWSTLQASLKGLKLLFSGINLQSAVSGPLRITYMTGDLAYSGFNNSPGEGLLSFFRFVGLINIALFIMNLLPIPVLDGGQILLFLAEGILRRKPNPVTLYRYQMIGTIIVFAIIIFATMNDILFFSRT